MNNKEFLFEIKQYASHNNQIATFKFILPDNNCWNKFQPPPASSLYTITGTLLNIPEPVHSGAVSINAFPLLVTDLSRLAKLSDLVAPASITGNAMPSSGSYWTSQIQQSYSNDSGEPSTSSAPSNKNKGGKGADRDQKRKKTDDE